MKTADLAPLPVTAGGTRTITMGRNRLSSIENWIKPSLPPGAQSVRASADLSSGKRPLTERPFADSAAPANTADAAGPAHADRHGRASGNPGPHRPVSQFVRTPTPAAPR